MRAEKTKPTQTPCQTSMALVYATGGKAELIEAVCVDMVNKVVTPRATRAGTAFGSNQKLTQDTMTSIHPGT